MDLEFLPIAKINNSKKLKIHSSTTYEQNITKYVSVEHRAENKGVGKLGYTDSHRPITRDRCDSTYIRSDQHTTSIKTTLKETHNNKTHNNNTYNNKKFRKNKYEQVQSSVTSNEEEPVRHWNNNTLRQDEEDEASTVKEIDIQIKQSREIDLQAEGEIRKFYRSCRSKQLQRSL